MLLKDVNRITATTRYRNFADHFVINLFPFIDQSYNLYHHKPMRSFSNLDFGYYNALQDYTIKEISPHTEHLLEKRSPNLIRRNLAYLYQKLKLISIQDLYLVSSNELMRSMFSSKAASISLALLRPNTISDLDEVEIDLVHGIYEVIMRLCALRADRLNILPITNMIRYLVARTKTDLSFISSFNLHENSKILTSSGGGYFNLLSTHFKDFNDVENVRFAHGGERIFFNDEVFWNYELRNIDTYFTYGSTWDRVINENFVVSKKIKIKHANSRHLTKLYRKRSRQRRKPTSGLYKILISGVSYVGEAVQFGGNKLPDMGQFQLEKRVCDALSEFGSVRYRKHPKGFGSKVIDEISVETVVASKSNVSEDFEWADVVVVSYFGTLAVEAVLSGKKVIYLDVGIRPVSTKFSDLANVVDCIRIDNDRNLRDIFSDYFASCDICVDEASLDKLFTDYFSG